MTRWFKGQVSLAVPLLHDVRVDGVVLAMMAGVSVLAGSAVQRHAGVAPLERRSTGIAHGSHARLGWQPPAHVDALVARRGGSRRGVDSSRRNRPAPQKLRPSSRRRLRIPSGAKHGAVARPQRQPHAGRAGDASQRNASARAHGARRGVGRHHRCAAAGSEPVVVGRCGGAGLRAGTAAERVRVRRQSWLSRRDGHARALGTGSCGK